LRLSKAACIPLEAIVEGHLTLMVSEYCPQGSLLGGMTGDKKCSRSCGKGGYLGLKDRLGFVFPLTTDEFCRSYVHNAKELSMIDDIYQLYEAGISRFRVEFTIENPEKAGQIIKFWRQETDRFARESEQYKPRPDIKERIEAMSPAGLTKGHYYRGVE